MELDILYFIANQRKLLRNELNDFIANYVGKNLLAIIALTDKIEHMCFNIGCPSSVEGMLNSIATGKIKMWSKGYLHQDQGKQLTGLHISQITHYYQDKKTGELDVYKGHFRWNWRGYMLDRSDIDYIKQYYVENHRPDLSRSKKFVILEARVYKKALFANKYKKGKKDSEKVDNNFYASIKTMQGGDYDFKYNIRSKKLESNLSTITPEIKTLLVNIFNEAIKMKTFETKYS